MWYKHMQRAISINSCYRRAVQHPARWIYCTRGVRGTTRTREKWVNKFISRSWVRLAEPGQMQPGCFSVVMLSQSDYLSHNSQMAWLLFSMGLSVKTSKSGVHMRSSALHSYCVMRTALTDQFLLPGSVMDILTNSAKAKSLMLLTKNKNFRSLLIFVPFTWFQDPSFIQYWFYPVTNRDEWRISNEFSEFASFFSS